MSAARPVLSSQEWGELEWGVLEPSRSGAVCITCQHVRQEVGRDCVTVLICPRHQGLIPRGDHVIKRCRPWSAEGS